MGGVNLKGKILVILVSLALLVGLLCGCAEEEATNKKPNAEFSIDITTGIYSGTIITFTDESTDSDGNIESWEWDFGDGTTSTESGPIEHSYANEGTYTVQLIVTDNDGAESDAYQMLITVTLRDIVAMAQFAGFNTLATALTAADLIETLQGEGPFTVFAPTDDAFAALNQTWLSDLLLDTTNLTKVLTYHVLSGEFITEDFTDGEYTTLEGTNITVVLVDTNLTVNGIDVSIADADIECSNGIIHIIGEVLLPDSVEGP
jgi:uncharacterized surface protein with fasciclin (FAS1) repeats